MNTEHRLAILDAATQAFARHGFKKASIDDIAARAGVGKGTVYLHFESKEALFAFVVDQIWRRVEAAQVAAMRGLRTPDGKLRAYLGARMDQLAAIARSLEISEATARELLPMARPHLAEQQSRELALVEEILTQGARAGVMHVREPRLVARGLLSWLDGLNVSLSHEALAERRPSDDALLDVVIRGLLVHPRPT